MPGEEDVDLLAGEYVLGTLPADDRLALERRLPGDAELARRIAAWQERLAPLREEISSVSAGPEVWQQINRSIGAPQRSTLPAWWERLDLWRGWAVATTGAALALLAMLLVRQMPTPLLVAVLDDPQGRPLWVVRATGDASRLIAEPLGEGAPSDRVPELWLLRDGQVISLALLDASGRSRRSVAGPARGELRVGDRLAVSIEPPGGSPTGRATGPVISRGVLVDEPS